MIDIPTLKEICTCTSRQIAMKGREFFFHRHNMKQQFSRYQAPENKGSNP
jgi:hypothetical protein